MSTVDTAAGRLKALARDLEHVAAAFDERVAAKAISIDRLTFILGDKPLADQVYNYVMLGHLSHAYQLRDRLDQTKGGKFSG